MEIYSFKNFRDIQLDKRFYAFMETEDSLTDHSVVAV
jgi:hypothetical protein